MEYQDADEAPKSRLLTESTDWKEANNLQKWFW